MEFFINTVLLNFLIAFGVVIGGCAFAGVGALITNNPPLKTMITLAKSIKVWAVAIALGGTFSSFEVIEEGVFEGNIRSLIKQIIYILSSITGANLGYKVIKLFEECGDIWIK